MSYPFDHKYFHSADFFRFSCAHLNKYLFLIDFKNTLGKPVPFSGNKGGSVIVGCYDAQGHERKNGEEYQRPNKKFFYRCTNGIEEVVGIDLILVSFT
jgi:hypothetical protein